MFGNKFGISESLILSQRNKQKNTVLLNCSPDNTTTVPPQYQRAYPGREAVKTQIRKQKKGF